ncbi:MAG: ankyrin repeat domain-containing protein [Actinobacteria bacterium]|nr:ankyrin repeat domain-containing protein [Actinomycetota bacterium]
MLSACGGPEAGSAVPPPQPSPVSSSPAPVATPSTSASPPLAKRDQRRLDGELRAAAYAKDVRAARRLIAAGADVNAKDASEQSAYLIATSEVGDDPRLLDLTLAHGADLTARDSFNGTGLIRAAERGFPTIVERLLAAGIEVDHVNELGWTALHEAIILGSGGPSHVDVVRQLVAAGADVMLPSQADGVRPIAHAERGGHDAISAILRKAARSLTPETRLLRAAARGSTVAAEAALADGADLEARDARRRTPLLRAVTADHVDVARMLVGRGADVNAVDDQRDTPFLVTGVTGSVAMLEALLPGRPDTRITNRFGGVAVIPASERGHAPYVEAVLDRTDIDVNHVNDLGWTALLEAVILGNGGRRHQRVVASLLAHGADPSIADRDGVTPLEHARRRGHEPIVTLLEAASS